MISEVQYLHGEFGRRCGGHKREGECALPGEICRPASVLPSARVGGMGRQKSAAGIVRRLDPVEGPNELSGKEPFLS